MNSANTPHATLLLHGLGRTGISMRPLATALRKQGHATLAPTYGLYSSLPAILDAIDARLTAFREAHPGPLDIVTHSLGGLIARALITRRRPQGLARVVMLAPPNCGSPLADLVTRFGLEKVILGQVGGQLRTGRTEADERILGPVDYPLGIIAGNKPYDPVLPMLLPKPNDGKVTVAGTKVDGMADHIVLPVSHTLMLLDAQVIAQTLAFLETGHFAREPAKPAAPTAPPPPSP